MSTPPRGEKSPSDREAALAVAAVALLFWALVTILVTHMRYGGNMRGLLCLADQNQFPPVFASVPTSGPTGYDGPMYATLATDPFLRHLNTPAYLDAPAYRATRMFVPMLAWILALGHAPAAIVLYQLLCWGLGVAAVFVVAGWLVVEQHSPWWALLAAGSAGMAAVAFRSTLDAAALCFILGTLYLHARSRPLPALVFAAAAVLTREASILAPLAIAVHELRRRRLLSSAAFAAVPAACGISWQLYLRHVLGDAFSSGGEHFSLPFTWLPHKFALVFQTGVRWQELFGSLAVLATTIALFVLVSRPNEWRPPQITFIAFAGMGLFFSWTLYCEAWAYGRALIVLPFLSVLIAGNQANRRRRWLLLSIPVFYTLAGLAMALGQVMDAVGPRTLFAALREGTPPDRAPRARQAREVHPSPSLQPPQWVLPVAHVRGRANSVWRTRLVIENLGAESNVALIEVYARANEGAEPERAKVNLQPHQRLEWEDAVGELVGRSWSGAMRVCGSSGPIAVAGITTNVSLQSPTPALTPALPEDCAVDAGEWARLTGLAYAPDPGSGVRTNIGVLNLAEVPIKVIVDAFDAKWRRLGQVRGTLESRSFGQVDDLFGRVRAPALERGHAEVLTTTPGGRFLAYASVIRGQSAPTVYVYPEPLSAPRQSH